MTSRGRNELTNMDGVISEKEITSICIYMHWLYVHCAQTCDGFITEKFVNQLKNL